MPDARSASFCVTATAPVFGARYAFAGDLVVGALVVGFVVGDLVVGDMVVGFAVGDLVVGLTVGDLGVVDVVDGEEVGVSGTQTE